MVASILLNTMGIGEDTGDLPDTPIEEDAMPAASVREKLESIEKNTSDLSDRVARIEKAGFWRWTKSYWMAVVPISLTVLGVVYAATVWVATHVVDDRVDAKLREHHFDQMASDVSTMKGQLGEISGFLRVLADNELHRQASLPKSEFEQQVPALAAAVTTARVVQAYAAPTVVKDINRRLVETPSNTPGYWNAAAQLISYRSDLQANFKSASLPDCLGSHVYLVGFNGSSKGYFEATLGMSHCRLDLGIDQLQAFREFASHNVAGPPFEAIHFSLDLTAVQVIYRGGEILPIYGITMHNCLFQIETEEDAPSMGKTLTKELLASDQPTVRIDLT